MEGADIIHGDFGTSCTECDRPVKATGIAGDGGLLVEASLMKSSNLTVVVVPSSKEMMYSFDEEAPEGEVSAAVWT